MSPKKWIYETNAIGIISKSNRYGETYAHSEFTSWISAEFKLYLIKDYQQLKAAENSRLNAGWNLTSTTAKLNYRIHTDAIKENLILPTLSRSD